MLTERRRQAAGAGGAAVLGLPLLLSVPLTGSVSGILLGWDQLPLCTPAASVCQAISPLPLLAQTEPDEEKEESEEGD